jgi:hypothetical protein
MTGILLLAVTLAWATAAFYLARWTTRPFKSPGVKLFVGIVMFPVFFIAPLSDELIGAWQFNALCEKYAVQVIDEAHARNRRVRFMRRNSDTYASGTLLRVRIDPYLYRDEETDQVLISFHILSAKGGWLIRTLAISETDAPLLFPASCEPSDAFEFRSVLNVTVIN